MHTHAIVPHWYVRQPQIKVAFFAVFAVATAMMLAQTIQTTASRIPGDNYVHVITTWTWSDNFSLSRGFYSDGLQDDSWRLNNPSLPSTTLLTIGTSDYEVSQSFNDAVAWSSSHSYNAGWANCGTCADAAVSRTMGDGTWHQDIAIVATVFNTISNAVSSAFSWAYSAISHMFE